MVALRLFAAFNSRERFWMSREKWLVFVEMPNVELNIFQIRSSCGIQVTYRLIIIPNNIIQIDMRAYIIEATKRTTIRIVPQYVFFTFTRSWHNSNGSTLKRSLQCWWWWNEAKTCHWNVNISHRDCDLISELIWSPGRETQVTPRNTLCLYNVDVEVASSSICSRCGPKICPLGLSSQARNC